MTQNSTAIVDWRVLVGDVLEQLRTIPDASVQTVCTSPPYWGLRDYGHAEQIGLEPTPDAYVQTLVEVFSDVRRVLKDDGTVWLNLGDSYVGPPRGNAPGDISTSSLTNPDRQDRIARPRGANSQRNGRSNADEQLSPNRRQIPGLKPKDLVGIPWMVAFALRTDGWYLRSDIIWCLSGGARVYARTQKGDMPMSVKDLVRLDPATVKLWNGEKWTQALGWSRSTDPRDALEIELRSGERIGCTGGHEWPTQRGNVRTDALAVGDVIQTTRLPEPNEPKMATALNEDVAWFCGLYLAEGSMSGETVQIAGHTRQTDARLVRLEAVAHRFHGTVRCHMDGESTSICMDGPIVASLVRAYIHGDSAGTKGLKSRTWQRDNTFLTALLDGYLHGDGHFDQVGSRWRLGFTRNDRLAADLRTMAARLGISMRLAPCTVTGFGREWPAYRGDLRVEPTVHHNARQDGEVVSVHPGRGRTFWDIGVEDDPHVFALASGVLTHNSKPNPMPESVQDRPTKAHEYLFLLSKSERYYYDADAIAEPASWSRENNPDWQHARSRWADGAGAGNRNAKSGGFTGWKTEDGRNCRSVWTIPTQPYPEAHFATFPEAIPERCIKAGSRLGDTVLDPFCGSGTTGQVAIQLGRSFIGIELNPAYADLSRSRIGGAAPLFAAEAHPFSNAVIHSEAQ